MPLRSVGPTLRRFSDACQVPTKAPKNLKDWSDPKHNDCTPKWRAGNLVNDLGKGKVSVAALYHAQVPNPAPWLEDVVRTPVGNLEYLAGETTDQMRAMEAEAIKFREEQNPDLDYMAADLPSPETFKTATQEQRGQYAQQLRFFEDQGYQVVGFRSEPPLEEGLDAQRVLWLIKDIQAGGKKQPTPISLYPTSPITMQLITAWRELNSPKKKKGLREMRRVRRRLWQKNSALR